MFFPPHATISTSELDIKVVILYIPCLVHLNSPADGGSHELCLYSPFYLFFFPLVFYFFTFVPMLFLFLFPFSPLSS